MLTFLLSIVFTLFPERYRHRIFAQYDVRVQRGSLASGLVEVFGCLAIFIVRFLFFMQYRLGSFATSALRKGSEEILADERVQFGAGTLAMFEYLLQPLTIILIYFIFEGVVRAVAGVITHEVLPSLPLQAIAWTHGLIERKQYEKSLGPLIEDIVKPGVQTEYDLRIETCRPRDWNSATTLDYEGHHYALVRAREQAPPRRFIYMFKISPPNRLIRSLYPYSPDELLLAQAAEAAEQRKAGQAKASGSAQS
jgi:hypothetical protein